MAAGHAPVPPLASRRGAGGDRQEFRRASARARPAVRHVSSAGGALACLLRPRGWQAPPRRLSAPARLPVSFTGKARLGRRVIKVDPVGATGGRGKRSPRPWRRRSGRRPGPGYSRSGGSAPSRPTGPCRPGGPARRCSRWPRRCSASSGEQFHEGRRHGPAEQAAAASERQSARHSTGKAAAGHEPEHRVSKQCVAQGRGQKHRLLTHPVRNQARQWAQEKQGQQANRVGGQCLVFG